MAEHPLKTDEQKAMAGVQALSFRGSSAWRVIQWQMEREKASADQHFNTLTAANLDATAVLQASVAKQMCLKFEKWLNDVIEQGNEADERQRTGNDG